MADQDKVSLGGTDIYFGPCKNSSRRGFYYVSFDKMKTYIVKPEDATEKRVREIGLDEDKWRKLSVQDPHNTLWNV